MLTGKYMYGRALVDCVPAKAKMKTNWSKGDIIHYITVMSRPALDGYCTLVKEKHESHI
jgi:hypothetical protein